VVNISEGVPYAVVRDDSVWVDEVVKLLLQCVVSGIKVNVSVVLVFGR
jgi:hypothetical protein